MKTEEQDDSQAKRIATMTFEKFITENKCTEEETDRLKTYYLALRMRGALESFIEIMFGFYESKHKNHHL